MRDRDRWRERAVDHLEDLITNDIELEHASCASDLRRLSIVPDEPMPTSQQNTGRSSVVEAAFSMSYSDGTTQTYASTIGDSAAQLEDFYMSGRHDPYWHTASNETEDVHDENDNDQDEEFEAPEMFEYANPGLHMEYTDTDVDLERTLGHLDLLECDDLDADVLSSYRERMEDMQQIRESDVRRGIDMQGIRWRRGFNARSEYRHYRLDTYDNYFNSTGKFLGTPTTTTNVPAERSYLRFVQNEIEFKCSLVHFQLRNLLTALDKNSVYFTNTNCVTMYDPQEHLCKIVMDLTDRAVTYPFKISSLAMADAYCCVGGFFGEYALKRLDSHGDEVHVGLVTTDMTGITNHLCPQITRSGAHQLSISSNDSCLRKMDVETLRFTQEIHLDHPLNCSATSADKRLQIVVADHNSSMLLDAETGELLRTIDGHTDYSFACAWSSDGHTFATGSQDLTTRLYDARGDTSVPIAIYRALMGAPRSTKFSPCGRFLAVAEPADFVHVYDMHDPSKSQKIDFFGEISGIDFAGDSFFIGNADKSIGGIAEYVLRRDRLGLEDAML